PDVFGRAFDDEEAGIVYRDNGIEAVVMKSHVVATADRAWLLRKHVPNMKAFGGVVLNAAVGGINPDAVQWMWRMQGSFGRVVWFPTFDADHHVKHFKDGPEGIKVLGSDGNVLPAVREVLKICAQQKLVVCTGHLSPAESLAVARAAREAGCDRVVITHAEFEVVHLSLEEMKQAAALGAKMEICAMGPLMGPNAHLTWMRSWRQVPYKESAERIKAVGAEHFLLATDLGQTGNPSPPDVAIKNGQIAAVVESIPKARAAQVIDATGNLVTPGLVDLHCHYYHQVSRIGLPADEMMGLTATTTGVDAGDAGYSSFSGF